MPGALTQANGVLPSDGALSVSLGLRKLALRAWALRLVNAWAGRWRWACSALSQGSYWRDKRKITELPPLEHP